VWHGTADHVVNPSNLTQIVRQWTAVHGISETPSHTDTIGNATHAVHQDSNNSTIVESWSISGMDHGVAIQPGLAVAGGCGQTGPFILDEGICSTYDAWQFFEAR
jgi:poly(3-hydroxybutyrate) depolymerase